MREGKRRRHRKRAGHASQPTSRITFSCSMRSTSYWRSRSAAGRKVVLLYSPTPKTCAYATKSAAFARFVSAPGNQQEAGRGRQLGPCNSNGRPGSTHVPFSALSAYCAAGGTSSQGPPGGADVGWFRGGSTVLFPLCRYPALWRPTRRLSCLPLLLRLAPMSAVAAGFHLDPRRTDGPTFGLRPLE